jgi:hypothetical protein
MDFGGIELARGGGELAHARVVAAARRSRAARRNPRRRRRAARSARASHHKPKPSMMADAMIPRPGAANGVVPKNGIGIAFWIAGVPGSADMVKVEVPSAIARASAGAEWRRRETPPAPWGRARRRQRTG